jgi:hypothetical protein
MSNHFPSIPTLNLVADGTGSTLADIQADITVQRLWTWQDSTEQFNLSYTDTMTYPS